MLCDRHRIERTLAELGLDALIATEPPNLTYLSGFYSGADAALKQYMVDPGASADPAGLRFAALVPDSPVALVLDPLSAVNAVGLDGLELCLWGDQLLAGDITPLLGDPQLHTTGQALVDQHSAPSPIDALVNLLRDRGVANGRIGLDTDWLSHTTRQAIQAALSSAEIKDSSNLFRLLRAVKSDQELALLEQAATINEAAMSIAISAAAEGDDVHEVGRLFRRELADAGAEFEHFLFGVGGVGAATETRYQLRKNEVMLVDFGCIARRYFADTGMTLALGEPAAAIVGAYEALHCSVRAGMDAIRPGNRASDVHRAMNEAAVAAGLTAVAPEGHGIGLEVRDYPIIAPDNGRALADDCISVPSDLTLETGMVINLEAAQFRPGSASLQCERSFVVTTTGVRDLIPQNREHLFITNQLRH
jgi:Xaa-Pro dipeptidase